jgi:hypothetical protein
MKSCLPSELSVYKERVSPGVQSSFNHSIPARVSNVSMTKGHAAAAALCVCTTETAIFPILVMRVVSLSLFSSHSNSEKYFSSAPLSRSAFVWVKQRAGRQAEDDDDDGGDGDECAVCA